MSLATVFVEIFQKEKNWRGSRPIGATPCVDIVKVDALLVRKNPKRHFFRDIGNSFHEVTHIGLEPHQIFSF